jgi:pilus assembly protein CpaC
MNGAKLVKRLLLTAMVPAMLLAGMQGARADGVTALTLRAGHSIVVPAPGLARIAVADAKVAGAVPIGTAEVVLAGKAPGHTTLFIWTKRGRASYEVNVTDEGVGDLAQMLRASIPNEHVDVVRLDRSVVVRGQVESPHEFLAMSELLSRFDKLAAAEKSTVVNAVTVRQPLGTLQSDVASIDGASRVTVDRDSKGNLIVSGTVHDRALAEKVLERIRAHAGSYLAVDGRVFDRLALETTTQVDVKVYVLEVDRMALNQLGVRLQSATPVSVSNGLTTYQFGDPSIPALESAGVNGSGSANSGPGVPGRALNLGGFFRFTVLAPTLDLLMRSGHARMLSSPDLVTMPGKEASFLVGGEIPIPFSTGLGQVSIVYEEFGVRLKVTPTIVGNGNVNTVIAPEVSDLDFQDGVAINGFTIPALKTSRLSTEVVTQAGESVILGGMLRRVEQRTVDKIPLLGNLPILGKLFRSTRYQSADTDVIFVMTPEVLER